MNEPANHGLPADWIVPQWPMSGRVRAFFTTRAGGVSRGPWGAGEAGGMNLGLASGDAAESVARNRALLNQHLPSSPRWLALQHGAAVVAAEEVGDQPLPADASTSCTPGVVCCVTVADCVPVLLADSDARVVAAAHAGWRGLAAGILQATVAAMCRRAQVSPASLHAFIGPCIGPRVYEVGHEVLDVMQRLLPDAAAAFAPVTSATYLADLPRLARQALNHAGISSIHGGMWCTASDSNRFYSHRRDRMTGRHAALIWLEHFSSTPV